MRTLFRTVLAALGVTVALILAAEIVLRTLFGLPGGTFAFTIDNPKGLWPPNAAISMEWGSIPYTVRTNSLGFRGNEFPRRKEPGVLRIAALGDSVIDGFSLENENTFPSRLEQALGTRGIPARVINAARGGGSIDRELAILRELVLPLKPDIVLLTFVTNDIYEIRRKSLPQLLSYSLAAERRRTGIHRWIITRTALGEALTDGWLRLTRRDYRAAEKLLGRPERYAIPGNDDFAGNAARFHALYDATDGPVLREPITAEAKALVSSYLTVLREMDALCRRHGVRFVLAYYPAYTQVYETAPSMWIRDILQKACLEASIPFLDLTPILRAHGKIPLHLAPLDYHPNPRGNEVAAAAAADFLIPLLGAPSPPAAR